MTDEETAEAQRATRTTNARYEIYNAKGVAGVKLDTDRELTSVEDALKYLKDNDMEGLFDIVVARRVNIKIKKTVTAE